MCFREGAVPLEWKSACVVSLYKGKGGKYECSSFRSKNLLSIVGKIYGSVDRERSARNRKDGRKGAVWAYSRQIMHG